MLIVSGWLFPRTSLPSSGNRLPGMIQILSEGVCTLSSGTLGCHTVQIVLVETCSMSLEAHEHMHKNTLLSLT